MVTKMQVIRMFLNKCNIMWSPNGVKSQETRLSSCSDESDCIVQISHKAASPKLTNS